MNILHRYRPIKAVYSQKSYSSIFNRLLKVLSPEQKQQQPPTVTPHNPGHNDHDHHHTCNDPTHDHSHHHHHHHPQQHFTPPLHQQEKDYQQLLDLDSTTEDKHDGIYDCDLLAIERKEKELMAKYPQHKSVIKKTLETDLNINKKEHEMTLDELRIYRAKQEKEKAESFFHEKKAIRVPNQSYEEQKKIQKKLVTPQGEESENESEAEGAEQDQRTPLNSAVITGKEKESPKKDLNQSQFSERLRIFQHLRIIDPTVQIPEKKNKNALTLFLELDDSLLHTYIYDENFGFMADPAPRDPEYKLLYGERNMPIHVYMRDYAQDFLKFLKENKGIIEPILYTSGQKDYTDLLLKVVDPNNEIFEHRLYQNACYVFEKKDEDIFQLIKDITRFKNRDIKRTILLDPNPLNFMLSPENCMPCVPYTAEFDMETEDKDVYLLGMIDQIQELAKLEDVRPYLKENYNVRQILKNSKLL